MSNPDKNGAWLGLLKWSLAYTDGTTSSEESMKTMSKEKRLFLEDVMKNGIIDEVDLMKTHLSELVRLFQSLVDDSNHSENISEINKSSTSDTLNTFQPRPVVFTGPSGVGKGTLIDMLMKRFQNDQFGFSVSHTTRNPREGEMNGVHYNFTSVDRMKNEIDEGKFIEHAQVHGNYYGTSVEAVESVRKLGKICILDIDVQGVRYVKKSALDPRYVFIAPPSMDVLERRLRDRGTENEQDIAKRLGNVAQEIEYGNGNCNFDRVFVNDDLGNTFSAIVEEIKGWYPHLIEFKEKTMDEDFNGIDHFGKEPLSANKVPGKMIEILLQLRDIIEQIDYAKAFASMGGITFLMKCTSERKHVPRSVRAQCLGVLSMICQNNPSVQHAMLEQNSMHYLSDLYFVEFPLKKSSTVEEVDGMVRSRIIQALSCSIRNHALAESKFCMENKSKLLLESGLGLHTEHETLPPPPLTLRKRTLFFLQALLTSDSSDEKRITLFTSSLHYIVNNFLDVDNPIGSSVEIREMALTLFTCILSQQKFVSSIIGMRGTIVTLGVKRVSNIRTMEGSEEYNLYAEELDLWERLIVNLARASIG